MGSNAQEFRNNFIVDLDNCLIEDTELCELAAGINVNVDVGNDIDVEHEEEMIHPPDLEDQLFTKLFVKHLKDDVENLVQICYSRKVQKLSKMNLYINFTLYL